MSDNRLSVAVLDLPFQLPEPNLEWL